MRAISLLIPLLCIWIAAADDKCLVLPPVPQSNFSFTGSATIPTFQLSCSSQRRNSQAPLVQISSASLTVRGSLNLQTCSGNSFEYYDKGTWQGCGSDNKLKDLQVKINTTGVFFSEVCDQSTQNMLHGRLIRVRLTCTGATGYVWFVLSAPGQNVKLCGPCGCVATSCTKCAAVLGGSSTLPVIELPLLTLADTLLLQTSIEASGHALTGCCSAISNKPPQDQWLKNWPEINGNTDKDLAEYFYVKNGGLYLRAFPTDQAPALFSYLACGKTVTLSLTCDGNFRGDVSFIVKAPGASSLVKPCDSCIGTKGKGKGKGKSGKESGSESESESDSEDEDNGHGNGHGNGNGGTCTNTTIIVNTTTVVGEEHTLSVVPFSTVPNGTAKANGEFDSGSGNPNAGFYTLIDHDASFAFSVRAHERQVAESRVADNWSLDGHTLTVRFTGYAGSQQNSAGTVANRGNENLDIQISKMFLADPTYTFFMRFATPNNATVHIAQLVPGPLDNQFLANVVSSIGTNVIALGTSIINDFNPAGDHASNSLNFGFGYFAGIPVVPPGVYTFEMYCIKNTGLLAGREVARLTVYETLQLRV